MPPASAIELEVDGFWGKPTSTLDWCEANYVVTPYIAEFWNTASSALIIGLPVVTIFSLLSCNVDKQFFVCSACFLAVGLGSFAFHMTLLYETQLMDELSMLWGACVLVYLFYGNNLKPNCHNYPLVVFLLLYAVSVTCIYIVSKDPVIHQIAFGLQLVSMVIRGIYCFRINKQEYSGMLLVLSILLYAIGFFLWIIDNEFCTKLRYLRSFLPAPFDAFLQLHAWWHVFACLGSHCLGMFCCHSRHKFLKRSTKIWTLGCLPLVAIDPKENGHLQ